jgi:hypothetical protein
VASPNIYPNGIGGTYGAELTTLSPLYTSGYVWYVQSTTGTDAASPAGRERNKPLATIAQAYTNAAAGDTIVLLSGHTEILAATQTLAKAGLHILGEGTTSTRPTFTRNVDDELFEVTDSGVRVENVTIAASSLLSSKSKIKVSSTDFRMVDVRVNQGANDTGPGLELVTGADSAVLERVSFVSTSVTTQPVIGMAVTNAISALTMDACTFDGGTLGWSHPHALDFNGAVTGLNIVSLNLYADSDVEIVTGTTGRITVLGKTGSARIEWAA